MITPYVSMATLSTCLGDLYQELDIMIYTLILLLQINGNAFSTTIHITNWSNLKIFLFLDQARL